LKPLQETTLNGENLTGAFSYNTITKEVYFQTFSNVNDVKFIEEVKWSTRSTFLYKNEKIVKDFKETATTIAIDPNDRVWVAHGKSNITIIDSNTLSETQINVGNPEIDGAIRQKTITFYKKFIRKTNSYEWNCLVFYSDEKKIYVLDLNGNLKTFIDVFDLFDYKMLQTYEQKTDKLEFLAHGDIAGYETKRIQNKIKADSEKIKISLKVSTEKTSTFLTTFETIQEKASIEKWNSDSWVHFCLVYKHGNFKLYANSIKMLELNLKNDTKLSYIFQPSFFVGNIVGEKFGLNEETGYATSIFNGKIADIRVYNYALNLNYINLFTKSNITAEDLIWPMSTPMVQYVEQVDRFFKHKMPGAKSQFFNLNIFNSLIKDPVTQKILEQEIRELIEQNKPTSSDLYKINWIN
jgi:hypothetical protein